MKPVVNSLEITVDTVLALAEKDVLVPAHLFDKAHDVDGGLQLLVGAGFTFHPDPAVRHRLAVLIKDHMERRHGVGWMTLLRIKVGSNRDTINLLSYLDDPGFSERFVFKVEEMFHWLGNTPRKETETCFDRVWVKTKTIITRGFLPLLRTYIYILDYVKD